ncbi:hypothetical protein [Nocardiopsis coralliicola]
MSLMVLFGFGSLAVLVLLAALFTGAMVLSALRERSQAPAHPARPSDDPPDDAAISAAFQAHGVHIR